MHGVVVSKITATDCYIPLVSESNASSKVLLELEKDHVVFYVAEPTKELRVKSYGSDAVQVLMQGVRHCHGFSEGGVAYLYIALVSGEIRLLIYRHVGELDLSVTSIAMGYSANYLHIIKRGGSYLMAIDTGAKLLLITSSDPYFTNMQVQQVYMNSRDRVYQMAKPVLEVHPDNLHPSPASSLVTIAVERVTLATKAKDVGFLVLEAFL